MAPSELLEYVSANGRAPFRLWFDALDPVAAAIVTVALARLADGNRSNLKPIGQGASELRINRGPGYRIYLGFDGAKIIVLIGGGTKQRQTRDIQQALSCWSDYKVRKSGLQG